MADFSFLSDSSDHKSAVEDILSQAMDQSILEQVAAINCSTFTSDSVLPTYLKTWFHKLKSFPATNPKPYSSFNSHFPSLNPQFDKSLSDDENGKKGLQPKLGSGSCFSPSKLLNSSSGNAIFSYLEENPNGKSSGKSKSRFGSSLFPSSNAIFSPSKTNPYGKLGEKLKSRSASFLLPSDFLTFEDTQRESAIGVREKCLDSFFFKLRLNGWGPHDTSADVSGCGTLMGVYVSFL